MTDRNAPRPPSSGLGLVSKNLALWALGFLLIIALVQFFAKKSAATEFTYTDFVHQLDLRNVATVDVIDGKLIRGHFRAKVTLPTDPQHPATDFTVLLPLANSEAILQRLEEAGVEINAKQAKDSLAVLLITALPWLVIIALWWFLFRQMQAGGNKRLLVREVEGAPAHW